MVLGRRRESESEFNFSPSEFDEEGTSGRPAFRRTVTRWIDAFHEARYKLIESLDQHAGRNRRSNAPHRQARDTESEFSFSSQNFLDEERVADRRAMHRTIARWTLAFIAVFCFAAMAFWWSGSAVNYTAARVEQRSKPTYKVSGTVTDAHTHQPVPWAEVTTDFRFGGAFFSTTADQNGYYSLDTLAEPQDFLVKANGYQISRIHVGKQWYSWTPGGSEVENAELTPSQ